MERALDYPVTHVDVFIIYSRTIEKVIKTIATLKNKIKYKTITAGPYSQMLKH